VSDLNVPPALSAARDRVRARLDETVDSHRNRIAIGVVVVLALVGGWMFIGRSSGSHRDVVASLPHAGASDGNSAAGAATSTTVAGVVSSGSSATNGDVIVQAAGAVVNPGVYHVASTARVADVVDAAGGSAPDADLERVNLAEKVNDGERVYIARKGQPIPPAESGGAADGGTASGGSTSGSASATAPSSPVDLNAATAQALDSLPGVGPSTAQAILDYRNAHGPFKSVQDLSKVKGIGPAKLEQLRSHVRV
jgi:competence protein ComEA